MDDTAAPLPLRRASALRPLDRWADLAVQIGVCGMLVMIPWEALSLNLPWHLCTGLALLGVGTVIVRQPARLSALWARPWGKALALFLVGVILAIITSHSPGESLRYFRKELLIYLVAFLGIALGFASRERLRRLIKLLAVSGVLACGLAVLTYHLYLAIDTDETRLEWIDDKIVSHDELDRRETLRAQYPLEHHNKLGFFAAATTLLVAHLAFTTRRHRTLWTLACVVPIWALLLSLNRGGLAGLMLAGFVAALLIDWRRAAAIAAMALLLALLILPDHTRAHYLTILSPSTYSGENELSSMTTRLTGWRGTMGMIADHPLLGIGHSWTIFEEIYPDYAPPEEYQSKPHAHNLWLEVAVEDGIPAAIAFAVFQFGLLAGCFALWRRTRARDLPLLISLQVLVLVVGVISYFFRERIGLLPWTIFGLSAAILLMTSLDSQREARPIE